MCVTEEQLGLRGGTSTFEFCNTAFEFCNTKVMEFHNKTNHGET